MVGLTNSALGMIFAESLKTRSRLNLVIVLMLNRLRIGLVVEIALLTMSSVAMQVESDHGLQQGYAVGK